MNMKQSVLATILTLFLAPSTLAQSATLYSTDFTTLDGWTVTTGCHGPPYMWAADATPADHAFGPYVSPPASLNFNNGVDIGGGVLGGPTTCGWVISDPIDLHPASGQPRLRFFASLFAESGCDWDVLSLKIRSAADNSILHDISCLDIGPWTLLDVPLDRAWGEIRIEFGFDTVDGWLNEGSGPFIDDLEVVDVGLLFCLGDGSEGACPCGNESPSADHAGCKHSGGTGGALRTSGRASLSDDTLVLMGSAMPDQPVLYFQADSSQAALPFGDGLRCIGGPAVRLGSKVNAAGASSYPGPGDQAISAKGMVGAPGVRHYSAWYRDSAAFCTPDTFNLTNAVTIVWEP